MDDVSIEPIEIESSLLRTDGGTQPREALSLDHIQDLAHSIEKGEDLPAVVAYYDGENYWLADGFHRVTAYESVSVSKISAVIYSGTLADAQWHSYSVNKHLALKRSNADKQRAVIGALKHPYGTTKSNVAIALHCGVDEVTVRRWRSKLEGQGEIDPNQDDTVTCTRKGTTYKLSTASMIGNRQVEEPQKFKVSCPDIPYYGQTVELVEIKSGECYQCKTQEGEVYPFFKKELIGVDEELPQLPAVVADVAMPVRSARERLIALVSRLPESVLEEALALLELRFEVVNVKQN